MPLPHLGLPSLLLCTWPWHPFTPHHCRAQESDGTLQGKEMGHFQTTWYLSGSPSCSPLVPITYMFSGLCAWGPFRPGCPGCLAFTVCLLPPRYEASPHPLTLYLPGSLLLHESSVHKYFQSPWAEQVIATSRFPWHVSLCSVLSVCWPD